MPHFLFLCKLFVDRQRSRFPEEKGVTAPEYGLMLGLVALAVAFGVPNITTAILAIFTSLSTELTTLSTAP
jgi:Flp pilus assembly pilin Flp